MPPVGFEPTISAGERPQAYALDRKATGTGNANTVSHKKNIYLSVYPPQLYHHIGVPVRMRKDVLNTQESAKHRQHVTDQSTGSTLRVH